MQYMFFCEGNTISWCRPAIECTAQDKSGLKKHKTLLESGWVHRRPVSGANDDKGTEAESQDKKTGSNIRQAIKRRNAGTLAMRRQRQTATEDRKHAEYRHKGGGDTKAQVLHIGEGRTITLVGKFTGAGRDLKRVESKTPK